MCILQRRSRLKIQEKGACQRWFLLASLHSAQSQITYQVENYFKNGRENWTFSNKIGDGEFLGSWGPRLPPQSLQLSSIAKHSFNICGMLRHSILSLFIQNASCLSL
jgi:hypothetical protein